jgi:signal transduction histidine kinase
MDLKRILDQSNLKMAYKGVILVSVPLILGLVFFSLLFLLLVRTEQEAAREAHSRRVASLANNFSRSVIDSAYSLSGYIFTRSELMGKRYDEQAAKLPQQVQVLAEEVRGNRQQTETVDRMRAFIERAVKLLNTLRNSSQEGSDPRTIIYVLGVRSHLNSLLKEFIEEEHKLVDAEAAEAPPDLMSSAKVREQLKGILLIGIVVNIAMSLLLAFYFSRAITGRLNVLVENTYRLAIKEKLLPTLQGDDEIAHLDAVFHQMASSLEEVERLKQEFVAMISHDLKTPISSVISTLGLVNADAFGPVSEKGKSMVKRSERELARLVNMLNDLLLVERLESGRFELQLADLELRDVLHESVEAVQQSANARSITITSPDTNVHVYADGARLVQVMINLLTNAIKFSPPHTTVNVSVEELPDAIELHVADEGRGVPEELHAAIFERFKQVAISDSSEKGGTGLGLPICKLIIEEHGGSIGVKSNNGKGSTFWFRIPRDIKSDPASPTK